MKKRLIKIARKHLVIFFLLLTSHLLLPAYIYSSDSANIIRKIEVEGLTRIEKDELIDLICLKPGSTLKREDLSTGIRRAFRKGVFLGNSNSWQESLFHECRACLIGYLS